MFSWLKQWLPYRELADMGVMGMNHRNISYISRYNSRSLYPLVDNKLATKRLAIANGVASPELLGIVDNQHDVAKVKDLISGMRGFCIKPAKGSSGKGILVVTRGDDGLLYRSNGQKLVLRDVERHVSNILAGLFSLGGAPDVAMIEALVEVDDSLRDYTVEGVPDLRIIVFRGFPVMAMVRLSCRASKGKANLHQGAVGVGIDMVTGEAVRAVQKDKPVHAHPDTGKALLSLRVPQWETLLELSCACADMTGLGYLGVDIVLDRHHGPMLLELNARPGLTIQMANGAGLLPRLRRIESIPQGSHPGVADRIRFAQRYFSSSSEPDEIALRRSA